MVPFERSSESDGDHLEHLDYPTSIVDGNLENCASKGMPDWLLLAVCPGGIHCQLRRRSDSVDGHPSAWLVPSRPAGDSQSLLG
ncbi:hypothetical protein EMIHUDRAFT_216716 [Emiliania huxleyi CCMP1516]|uniref:Uncharacterized protein n=2 Tax=Emiliania huxleyi TaxID=2903 RepID=A0A0D3IDH9_EMIH1|nr:hypothetical protein EMIHUDRAFT_216716 [Emiliania huxleyi CCMP1516]EOD09314.1 hypothetical protein EMIHUDRAFT_216716 [Emiliania huxleyi CCMP1516]|eukprot:XP_005761743.1 hypothetical protein EMIHUDRAFT_216716 [Emiliania huxleyi CCMP1516]